MSRNIKKAKLLRGDKIEVEFKKETESETKAAEVTEKHKMPPHPDLINAFAGLDVHFALLGEFVPLVNVPDIANPDKAILDKFHVSGITIVKPGDDDEGVIITGGKTLKTGRVMGCNTPTTRFNDVSDEKYQYLNELQDAVKVVLKEVDLYLDGKFAAEVQGKLALGDGAASDDGTGEDEKDK